MVTIYTGGAALDVVDEAPVVVPPAWPARAPDMLDLDLTGLRAIVTTSDAPNGGAKWLDGNPGWNGKGNAIHYGDMAGAWPTVMTGTDVDWDNKLAGRGFAPVWGVESNGLHYLETGAVTQPRAINWVITRFAVPQLYYRFMLWIAPETLARTTELGIKLSGVDGALAGGGTFAEIFELGNVTQTAPADRTSFPLQAYRYDAEVTQGVTIFPDVQIFPSRWYTMEGRVRVESSVGAKDGIMEYRLDGQTVFARSDVKMGATTIGGFQVQLYHGGLKVPAGLIRFRVARVALSRGGWIGPAPEIGA